MTDEGIQVSKEKIAVELWIQAMFQRTRCHRKRAIEETITLR